MVSFRIASMSLGVYCSRETVWKMQLQNTTYCERRPQRAPHSGRLTHRVPDVAFIHASPGIVETGILDGLGKGWYPFVLKHVVNPLIARAPEDAGQRLLYNLLEQSRARGAHFADMNGEPVKPSRHATPKVRALLRSTLEEKTRAK